MPQLIALDFSSQGARLLRAVTKGPQLVLSEAVALEGNGGDLTAAVHAQLRSWKAGKASLLLLVPRSDCELRTLSLPAVPEDELPDMVRFQALQQFASIGDDWPSDFVKLFDQDGTSLVLAATLPRPRLTSRVAELEAAGCQVKGALLRPGATAVLVDRCQPDLPACRLIVDRMDDRAELTIVDHTRLFLSRSVLLVRSSEDPRGAASLLNETRRTLAACRSQFSDIKVAQLVVTGGDEAAGFLAHELQRALDIPAAACDPFVRCACAADWQGPLPDEHANFAAAVGALLEESQPSGQRFDFLRPRKAPTPVSRQPLWTAVALSLAAVVLVAGGMLWHALREADREILNLRRRVSETDKLVEAAQRQMREVEMIEEWFERSPNWLVELRHLSDRMPLADRLRLQHLQADRLADGGGRITMKGYVDEPLTVAELEVTLRDGRHSLVGLDRDFVGSDPRYPWYFMEEMGVQHAGEEDASAPASDRDGASPGAAGEVRPAGPPDEAGPSPPAAPQPAAAAGVSEAAS